MERCFLVLIYMPHTVYMYFKHFYTSKHFIVFYNISHICTRLIFFMVKSLAHNSRFSTKAQYNTFSNITVYIWLPGVVKWYSQKGFMIHYKPKLIYATGQKMWGHPQFFNVNETEPFSCLTKCLEGLDTGSWKVLERMPRFRMMLRSYFNLTLAFISLKCTQ